MSSSSHRAEAGGGCTYVPAGSASSQLRQKGRSFRPRGLRPKGTPPPGRGPAGPQVPGPANRPPGQAHSWMVVVKVSLTTWPESVEELITILREKLNPRLDFEFTLQYEDPDFDGQLTCLLDIQELPEKGTLKVVRSESDVSSCASSDTDILPHVPLAQRLKCWPDTFPVPTFSYEVEHLLEEGNRAFEMSGKHLKLTRAQKHNILETMASVMHTFKAYPSDRDVGLAAEALVTTHPCLKEPGSRNRSYGWKTSLKFKMGNYRTKLARSGCVEVSVNAGRRSVNNPEGEHPHSNIKRGELPPKFSKRRRSGQFGGYESPDKK
ncbi:unnamed protein product [Oreochromis niloticus]|nr:unnamed protein product [Mustela putorius furo]